VRLISTGVFHIFFSIPFGLVSGGTPETHNNLLTTEYKLLGQALPLSFTSEKIAGLTLEAIKQGNMIKSFTRCEGHQ
jgi:hypothetical protein